MEQLLQGRVDHFLSGAADPFVTDDSLAIEDIVRRRAGVGSDYAAPGLCATVMGLRA